MKAHNKISLAALIVLFLISGFTLMLDKCTTVNPTAVAAHPAVEGVEYGFSNADLRNYEAFRKSVMPLINQMAAKKIVSLGEGTHGTLEFNKIRFWITRILVEEKGFNHIAFENDYGDAYLLNESLKKKEALKPLMRQYLLRIWQNQEVEELFQWMQAYNSRHKNKLQFNGIDHAFMSSEAKVLAQLLASQKNEEVRALTQQLLKHSNFQDSVWNRQNDTTFRIDMKQAFKNGVEGYKAADRLEQLLASLRLAAPMKEQCQGLVLDSKLGFNLMYQWSTYKTESSRDSLMAEMASWIARKKEDKLIIWAHNVHVSKSPVMRGVVGGMGGFIEKKMPGQYFVMGTGTALGKFAAMEERIINHGNPLAVYPLEAAVEGSWEHKLSQRSSVAFYASTLRINPAYDTLKHRHIGYGPTNGDYDYDQTNLSDLYDAFFFIRETNAARFFE